jgi:chemosensory pili system protein ChpA (sensor histidine kinase/response regulator)
LLPEPPAKSSGIVASAAEIDAELLGVYLEEATEVLGGILIHLDVLRGHTGDREALTVIRRGFHTLKGSGRMVGLTELGEVAWQVEQVMNKWLLDEKPASQGLLKLIEDAHRSFGGWIKTLQAGAQPVLDAHAIVQLAELLKNEQDAPEVRPITPTAPITLVAVPSSAVEPPKVVPFLEEAGSSQDVSHKAPAPTLVEVPTRSKDVQATTEPPAEPIAIGEVMLDPAFFAIFSQEAAEHDVTLGALRAQLAIDPATPVTHDFMRAAHTLGGIARTTGFPAIAELGFALEMWLQDRLQHPSTLSVEQVTLTTDAVNALSAMVHDVQARRAPQSHPEVVARLDAELTRGRQLRSEEMETWPHDKIDLISRPSTVIEPTVPPVERKQPVPP